MIFTSDLEGPFSKNDNAFELADRFIEDGDTLFSVLSAYDDVQADIVKRKGYKAGDTLKLILPFFKAVGVTNEEIVNYSSNPKNVLLVPGAAETLKFVSGIMPSAVISTSYEHYVSSVCDLVSFSYENAYCTKMNIDKYGITDREKSKLEEFRRDILDMSNISIPKGAKSLKDLSEIDRLKVKAIDEIIWEKIAKMKVGEMLKDVNPIGGIEKANAVKDFVSKRNGELENTIYVGDSITDVYAYRLVRNAGGLTVSFNGNDYAVREAEIAVLSPNTQITSYIADVFSRDGKAGVFTWVDKLNSLAPYGGRVKQNPKYFPQAEMITEENRERLAKESSDFRKTVRGEAIGKLG